MKKTDFASALAVVQSGIATRAAEDEYAPLRARSASWAVAARLDDAGPAASATVPLGRPAVGNATAGESRGAGVIASIILQKLPRAPAGE